MDAVVLQETKHVLQDSTPNFPGFSTICNDREGSGKKSHKGGGRPHLWEKLDSLCNNAPVPTAEIQYIRIPMIDCCKISLCNIYILPIKLSYTGPYYNYPQWLNGLPTINDLVCDDLTLITLHATHLLTLIPGCKLSMIRLTTTTATKHGRLNE